MSQINLNSFCQNRIVLDGRSLKNLSDPDCLGLWERSEVKFAISSLLYNRGFGKNDFFTPEMIQSQVIQGTQRDLKRIFGMDVILTSNRLSILNWILSYLITKEHLVVVCEDFEGPILEICELQGLRYAELGLSNLHRIKELFSIPKKGVVVFAKDGTVLGLRVLEIIEKLVTFNTIVVLDVTYTFLDYVFEPSFKRFYLYIFSPLLLGIPHLYGLFLDLQLYQILKMKFAVPYPAEFFVEAFKTLVLFAREIRPRDFNLKEYLVDEIFSIVKGWGFDLRCPNKKIQLEIFNTLVFHGYFAAPYYQPVKGGRNYGLIFFNNSSSHDLSREFDIISKIKKILTYSMNK